MQLCLSVLARRIATPELVTAPIAEDEDVPECVAAARRIEVDLTVASQLVEAGVA